MKTVRDKQAKIVQVATTNARTIIYNLINVYQPYPKLITEHKEAIDQAPKKLEELLLECKPEKKTKKDVPDPYEVGIHATIPVAQASGYNQALDQWEQAILELMK